VATLDSFSPDLLRLDRLGPLKLSIIEPIELINRSQLELDSLVPLGISPVEGQPPSLGDDFHLLHKAGLRQEQDLIGVVQDHVHRVDRGQHRVDRQLRRNLRVGGGSYEFVVLVLIL